MRTEITFLMCMLSFFGVSNHCCCITPPDTCNRQNVAYLNKISASMSMLYDSANIWWQSTTQVHDTVVGNDPIPEYPPYIYEQRIRELNRQTPVRLDYNEHVGKYIAAYGVSNRPKLRDIMARSVYYFPIFEMYLDRYDLPFELKYLAAVESALNPEAKSKSGAVGLWQFMKSTSDLFDMTVTSYIDDRKDVYVSTDAACRYLKSLYEIFGDWQLVLAAYNGGPGAVKKAIARSGGKVSYWELRPYLTEQMQNYVPAFIAMNYLMNYHAEHNLFPDTIFTQACETDTLHVAGPLYLQTVADITGTDIGTLKALNPVYTYNYIPDDNHPHTLVLPSQVSHIFIVNSENNAADRSPVVDSLAQPPEPPQQTPVPPFMNKPQRNNVVYYITQKGDNLYRISLKFNCSVPELYQWNNLDDNYILKVDDKLKIMVE